MKELRTFIKLILLANHFFVVGGGVKCSLKKQNIMCFFFSPQKKRNSLLRDKRKIKALILINIWFFFEWTLEIVKKKRKLNKSLEVLFWGRPHFERLDFSCVSFSFFLSVYFLKTIGACLKTFPSVTLWVVKGFFCFISSFDYFTKKKIIVVTSGIALVVEFSFVWAVSDDHSGWRLLVSCCFSRSILFFFRKVENAFIK